jgi:hypothetical protein
VAVVECEAAVVVACEEVAEAGVALVAVAAGLAGCPAADVILEGARVVREISAAVVAWEVVSMAAVGPAARASSMGVVGSTVLVVAALTARGADSMEPAGAVSMVALAEGLTGLAAWMARPVAVSTELVTSPVQAICHVRTSRNSPTAVLPVRARAGMP